MEKLDLKILKKVVKLKAKRTIVSIILFFLFSSSYSQDDYTYQNQNIISDSIIKNYVIDLDIHRNLEK